VARGIFVRLRPSPPPTPRSLEPPTLYRGDRSMGPSSPSPTDEPQKVEESQEEQSESGVPDEAFTRAPTSSAQGVSTLSAELTSDFSNVGSAAWHRQRTEWLEGSRSFGSGQKAIPSRGSTPYERVTELGDSEHMALVRCLEDTSGRYAPLRRPLPLPLVVACAARTWAEGDMRSFGLGKTVGQWLTSSLVDPMVGALQAVGLGSSPMKESSPASQASPSKPTQTTNAVLNSLRIRGGMVRDIATNLEANATSTVSAIGAGVRDLAATSEAVATSAASAMNGAAPGQDGMPIEKAPKERVGDVTGCDSASAAA